MKSQKCKSVSLLNIALVCLILFGGTSCSENDENNGFSIVGEWNIDQATTIIIFNGHVEEDVVYNAGKMNFMSDGNGIMYDSEGDVATVFEWSLSDGTLFFTPSGEPLHLFNVEVITSTNIILDLDYYETKWTIDLEQLTIVLSKI